MPIPTHVETWDTIPRDMDINDRSRFRSVNLTEAERAATERSVNLGSGLTQVTYIDSLTAPASEN